MENINPEIFELAFKTCKSYMGMGSIHIVYNPYESVWEVDINYSDDTHYKGKNIDINVALAKATNKLIDARGTRYGEYV